MGGRSAVGLNPFQSVRGVRHPFGEGRTPEMSVEQARHLLASVRMDSVFGLRDRVVLGTLIYSGARVGAGCRIRIRDLRNHGNNRALQFSGKRGASPGRPRCGTTWTCGYRPTFDAAGLWKEPKGSWLFRAEERRGIALTDRACRLSPCC